VRTLQGHGDRVTAVAITPDGGFVVSASDDKTTVRIWELKAGQSIGILRGHSDGVTAVAITPDGGRAISASDDKTPRVWELELAKNLCY
jgi:WD40 repeat protein